MRKLIILSIIFLFIAFKAHPQGCIIVRNISGLGQYDLKSNSFSNSSWQLNINNRYFKAYRDYKGKVDQKTPPANENVINSYSMDLDFTKLLQHGWAFDLGFPISANSRTTDLEHGGLNTARHTTSAYGMGDLQITALKWLLKTTDSQKGNIQIGLGIKFPTGDFKKQGYFYRNDTTRVLSLVNPSIQLGDGGTGIVTELNAFYFFNQKRIVGVYGNFYYLISPTDINGTQFTQGKPLVPLVAKLGGYDVSVLDVFSIRAGIDLNIKTWTFSGGIRDEGAPVHDLIGGSDGIRRSGYTLSAEPGITHRFKNASAYIYLPFLLSHEIKQTPYDKAYSKATGVYTVGAGGSGDYQLFLGVQFQL